MFKIPHERWEYSGLAAAVLPTLIHVTARACYERAKPRNTEQKSDFSLGYEQSLTSFITQRRYLTPKEFVLDRPEPLLM